MATELTPSPVRLPNRPLGTPAFTMPVAGRKPLPPEALYHFWHPNREGVERCPKGFAKELAAIHVDLAIVKPPAQAPTPTRPWLVWYRKPSISHYLSPGWMLLFAWQTREGEPLPLDNRVFANLYRISARAFGNGLAYFNSVVATLESEKAARDKADTNYRHDHSDEYFEYTKIKSSGRGNKFALHHDGSVVPSRGEANWMADRDLSAMPKEVADETKAKREAKRERESQHRGRTGKRRR